MQNPLEKYHSKFERIESKLKQYPIIGFDTEDDSKGTPVLFAFYGDFPAEKYVTRHWREALDFIYSLQDTTIFVAHNLEYDIANLFKADNYLMVNEMLYASTLLHVTMYGTPHYFINSMCFFKGKLESMAGFVGLQKYEGSALDENYITQDAKIVYTFMKKFQDKLVTDIKVNLGVTIGQMAMQTYRRDYLLSDSQITYNSPNCLKAYYGGRVEIFNKGNIHNVHVTDINSCYPYVMRNRYYPDTSRIVPSSIDTHEYGIGKFKVRVPKDCFIPVLPYKSKNGKLFFPTGEFTGWWTYQEVRHAQKYGTEILKEYEGEGTNHGCKPFDKFVDTFYNLRIETKDLLKKDPDNEEAKFDNLLWKLWLNHLYGKFCQWRPGNTMVRDKWSDFQLAKWRQNPEFKESKIGPFYNYRIPKLEPPKTANFMWGIYVTSYARIYLHEGMEAIHNSIGTHGGASLLYCDTDSIMYSPGNDNSFKSPLKVSSKLGDWDIEKFDLGIFRQAKGYLLCDKKGGEYEIVKCASKGVPTHLAYDFIIDGMASVQKPMRLKEALIRTHANVNKNNAEFLNEIGENVWYSVEKEMHSVYIKRKLREPQLPGKKGVTYPVDAAEIEELEKNEIQKTFTSIKEELAENEISIKKPAYKNLFENTVIPAGYFDRKRDAPDNRGLFISHKIFQLRAEQCIELTKGQSWFTGDVLQVRKQKGKRFYYILIENFKGRKAPKNLWGKIAVKFVDSFGMTENLIQKKVEFILANNYNSNVGLSLRIKTKVSKIQGQFETEVTESEELTEKQLKTLMSLEWSKISCLNQKK